MTSASILPHCGESPRPLSFRWVLAGVRLLWSCRSIFINLSFAFQISEQFRPLFVYLRSGSFSSYRSTTFTLQRAGARAAPNAADAALSRFALPPLHCGSYCCVPSIRLPYFRRIPTKRVFLPAGHGFLEISQTDHRERAAATKPAKESAVGERATTLPFTLGPRRALNAC